VRAVRQLAEHYGKSPDCIGEEELRQYLLYLKNDEQVSLSAFTIALCGIKFFFQHTLRREWTTPESTQGSSRSLILKEVNRHEQRRCTQTGSPPRGRGRRFPAPVLAPAWRPKNGLRQAVTPAAESPGLARDPPPSRLPRAGGRFTCADGLPLAQCAARSPKRGFALIPKWEYNLVADQYDRQFNTDYAAAAHRMNPSRWAARS
jgi:hypothetical protein